jgi:hypothetical protein
VIKVSFEKVKLKENFLGAANFSLTINSLADKRIFLVHLKVETTVCPLQLLFIKTQSEKINDL